MTILLKNLLNETTPIDSSGERKNPLKVQIYCDLDGVLVDMDKGFKKISGGYSCKNFKDKFDGNTKMAQKEFWKLIGGTPNFWVNLEPMPDAFVLWKFITQHFKDPKPVILTAGQGADIAHQKKQWVLNHLGAGIDVFLSPAGHRKPEHIIHHSTPDNSQYVTHVLIDDTEKNIISWNNPSLHRIAIHHVNAAESIKALAPFLST